MRDYYFIADCVENYEPHYMAGYDGDGDLYYPIMIEIDDCGEYVRVYQECNRYGVARHSW